MLMTCIAKTVVKRGCYRRASSKGYQKERLMMVGDSPGDLAAAEQNQVAFFPILVGKEAQSWADLKEAVAAAFVTGELSDLDFNSLKETFWHNLD